MNGNVKKRIDNKFVVPLYKQQYSIFFFHFCLSDSYSIAQFDEFLFT